MEEFAFEMYLFERELIINIRVLGEAIEENLSFELACVGLHVDCVFTETKVDALIVAKNGMATEQLFQGTIHFEHLDKAGMHKGYVRLDEVQYNPKNRYNLFSGI